MGLTATALDGTGWTVDSLGRLTATRSDSLASDASYSAFMLTVDVAPAPRAASPPRQQYVV